MWEVCGEFLVVVSRVSQQCTSEMMHSNRHRTEANQYSVHIPLNVFTLTTKEGHRNRHVESEHLADEDLQSVLM